MFNTNVFSVLLLTHGVLPLLRKSAAGRIVNVSSTTGPLNMHANHDPMIAHTKRFAYNASKAAFKHVHNPLGSGAVGHQNQVNSILPG